MIFGHLISGLLTLPIVIGLFDRNTNITLFLIATYVELSWEIEDLINRFYRRFKAAHPEVEEPV